MDMVRLGLILRALRRRKGWRQRDVAEKADVSQSLVSLVERGHGDRVTAETLRRITAAVDARLVVDVRWRGGDLDRLLDAGHARVVDAAARRLRALGWEPRIEVTYEAGRSVGSIDILAWHPATASVLVIEVKTEISSGEATLRKLDEKVRVGRAVARERLGWPADRVSRLLVLEATSTNRRRINAHRSLFDGALPLRDDGVRAWLRRPSTAMDGRLFVSPSNAGRAIHVAGGRHRVRSAKARPSGTEPRTIRRAETRPTGMAATRHVDTSTQGGG